MPFDVKKEFKDLYAPKPGPHLVTVPPARFIAVRGQGDPNDPMGEYARAVPMLYAVIYTIKMSKMGSRAIAGFEDFVVPPLEGLWWMPGIAGVDYARKERFSWISMIRLPDFADDEVVAWAKAEARSKRTSTLPLSRSSLTMRGCACNACTRAPMTTSRRRLTG